MKKITFAELWRRFWAVLWLRCSHCLRGPVYGGLFRMHERCPVCGIQHEREHGFFLMAIVFGYAFYLLVLMPLSIWLYRMGVQILQFVIAITVVSIVLIPPVFHYARVLWLHIDEVLDPRQDGNSGEL